MYTIQNLPSGTSVRVQWGASNNNLQLVSGQGTRTAVFSKRSKGQCAIRAQVIINGNTINTEKTGFGLESRIFGVLMDMNRCLLQGLNIIERMFPVIQVVFGSVMTKRGVK